MHTKAAPDERSPIRFDYRSVEIRLKGVVNEHWPFREYTKGTRTNRRVDSALRVESKRTPYAVRLRIVLKARPTLGCR